MSAGPHDASDPLLGAVLGGRYRVERVLGAGGMGTVYRGVQEPLGRPVAIKVLHEAYGVDAELIARFRREAELAASLHHPNVAQVTDFGVDGGRAWLVMDLLEGTSLHGAIAAGAPLAAERVRRIATQVLSALEAAHARGVVHRDLKPDNVFLVAVSGIELVKLLDFGIARLADPEHAMTQTGRVLGTPAYMAPEQARGRPVGPATDLFALGVVMYEALAGRRPFEGDNYHALMFAIVEQRPAPLGDAVPPALAAIVERAMAKDPAERFESAAAMRAALDALGPLEEAATSPDAAPIELASTLTPEALAALGSVDDALEAGRARERGGVDEEADAAASAFVSAPRARSTGRRALLVALALLALATAGGVAAHLAGREAGGVSEPRATSTAALDALEPIAPRPREALEAAASPVPVDAPGEEPLDAPGEEPLDAPGEEPLDAPVARRGRGASAGSRPPRAARRSPAGRVTRILPCANGRDMREAGVVRAGERLSIPLVSVPGVGATVVPEVRRVLADVVAPLSACLVGHAVEDGQRWQLDIERGAVTRAAAGRYCPLDAAAVACAERALARLTFPAEPGAYTVMFSTAHR
ncbi:MAG: protein kinase [Sandaracinaceae bacterium]|nr:protein kinase [Sandaracinaceae bacterium]